MTDCILVVTANQVHLPSQGIAGDSNISSDSWIQLGYLLGKPRANIYSASVLS